MLRRAKELDSLRIRADDGDIGASSDIYFDDERWTIRYFVVDTGRWLPGRKVLISPMSVRQADLSQGRLEVSLTKEQVKNSPDINTDQPVSRRNETRYAAYYGYPYYWVGPGLWGAGAYPAALAAPYPAGPALPLTAAPDGSSAAGERDDSEESHLRSAVEVRGYHIEATDGEIGHVEDFLIDDETWSIGYLIVDTSNWLGGRRVLMAPAWIHAVSWGESKVRVSHTREQVRSSPAFDPDAVWSSDDEQQLQAHYAGPRGAPPDPS